MQSAAEGWLWRRRAAPAALETRACRRCRRGSGRVLARGGLCAGGPSRERGWPREYPASEARRYGGARRRAASHCKDALTALLPLAVPGWSLLLRRRPVRLPAAREAPAPFSQPSRHRAEVPFARCRRLGRRGRWASASLCTQNTWPQRRPCVPARPRLPAFLLGSLFLLAQCSKKSALGLSRSTGAFPSQLNLASQRSAVSLEGFCVACPSFTKRLYSLGRLSVFIVCFPFDLSSK